MCTIYFSAFVKIGLISYASDEAERFFLSPFVPLSSSDLQQMVEFNRKSTASCHISALYSSHCFFGKCQMLKSELDSVGLNSFSFSMHDHESEMNVKIWETCKLYLQKGKLQFHIHRIEDKIKNYLNYIISIRP